MTKTLEEFANERVDENTSWERSLSFGALYLVRKEFIRAWRENRNITHEEEKIALEAIEEAIRLGKQEKRINAPL